MMQAQIISLLRDGMISKGLNYGCFFHLVLQGLIRFQQAV
jgi:hypothetical protein